MTYDEFEKAVYGFYDYLHYVKEPNPDAIGRWFKRVEKIPSIAIPYIVNFFEDSCDTVPRNIPKFFHKAFMYWQQNNPCERAYQQKPCDECGGAGVLWYGVHEPTDDLWHDRMCICACCDNWRLNFGRVDRFKRATRAELKAQGLPVFPSQAYWDVFQPKTQRGDDGLDSHSGLHPGILCGLSDYGGLEN